MAEPSPERTHRCYSPHCSRRCRPEQVFCWWHWVCLPAPVRREIAALLPPDKEEGEEQRAARVGKLVGAVQGAIRRLVESGKSQTHRKVKKDWRVAE
jgi:hypothetical protein